MASLHPSKATAPDNYRFLVENTSNPTHSCRYSLDAALSVAITNCRRPGFGFEFGSGANRRVPDEGKPFTKNQKPKTGPVPRTCPLQVPSPPPSCR